MPLYLFLTKDVPSFNLALLPPSGVDCLTPSLKPLGMGRECHIAPETLSSPNSNFQIQASFIAVVIVVVSFFLTSVFIYTYVMLVLINGCLLNVIFSMTKALNGRNSPK